MATLGPSLEGWMPPTRENWEFILKVWQWSFPIVRLPSPLSPHTH